jgi:uncharacterized protein (TIGR02271 family)
MTHRRPRSTEQPVTVPRRTVIDPADGEVLPIVEEQVTVGKRRVPGGKVRVRKHVDESEETLDVPLVKECVEVRRVEIGQWIDAPVPIRQEGDTTVLPVMEEVLVVEKRLRLVEEIHLVTHRQTVQHRESVRLRRERVEVDREKIDTPRDRSE